MLKQHFDIKFNFNKDDIKKDEDLRIFMTELTQGIKGSTEFLCDKIYPPRPLKSNTHRFFDKDHLSAVYLINDERISTIMDNGTIMYAGVGNEVDELSRLIKDDYGGFSTDIQVQQLKDWDFLDKYITPMTDIIIADRYILLDDTLYEYNIYPLLRKLCQKVRNASVNITFFTTRPDNQRRTPRWDTIRREIRSRIQQITGQAPKVTFVLFYKMPEHDRTIFTNYQCLCSGDSLNYFDSKNGVITNGRYLTIKSAAHRNNYINAMQFINDMQTLINKLKRDNPDAILFDKSSCYLKF